jgi:hypothetical protein
MRWQAVWMAMFAANLGGCAQVVMTRHEPVECEFRGDVESWQACEDVRPNLRRAVHDAGGNTLQCCWFGESLSVYATNKRTGKVCDLIVPVYGKAYRCPKGWVAPPPPVD